MRLIDRFFPATRGLQSARRDDRSQSLWHTGWSRVRLTVTIAALALLASASSAHADMVVALAGSVTTS
jgi:hypothetical protein